MSKKTTQPKGRHTLCVKASRGFKVVRITDKVDELGYEKYDSYPKISKTEIRKLKATNPSLYRQLFIEVEEQEDTQKDDK